jgi:outer membrane protein TolC
MRVQPFLLSFLLAALMPGAFVRGAAAQPPAQPGVPLEMTLEKMVELGLRDSFRVRQLELEVERTRSLLKAEQAGLKSRVTLNVSAPQFQAISDNKWNSTLQRNELVRENTRRYQFDLAIRQPVILFGYPTNGVLSLNNRVYRYTQIDGDDRDTQFYNRYFVAYSQPLFQPNRMRNNLEEARLGLEKSELKYQADVVGIIDDLSSDYFDLVSDAYKRQAAQDFLEDLNGASAAARDVAAADASRTAEAELLQVEVANAQESISQATNNLRNRGETIKQRLQLAPSTTLTVRPDLAVVPVVVDEEEAVRLAVTATPPVRQLYSGTRENDNRLQETRGNEA